MAVPLGAEKMEQAGIPSHHPMYMDTVPYHRYLDTLYRSKEHRDLILNLGIDPYRFIHFPSFIVFPFVLLKAVFHSYQYEFATQQFYQKS